MGLPGCSSITAFVMCVGWWDGYGCGAIGGWWWVLEAGSRDYRPVGGVAGPIVPPCQL